jgi:hypothetical protein
MVSDSERAKILEMIESGTITAEEGLTLLEALGESAEPEVHDLSEVGVLPPPIAGRTPDLLDIELDDGDSIPDPDGAEAFEAEVEVLPDDPTPPDPEEIQRWKRWWVIPLWVGTGITVLGGLLMYWAFSANGYGFWFACAWFPFLLGVALLALAWGSRTAPWIHVRVHQAQGEKPQKIAISFPIPIRLTTWGLKTFGHRIPHMENTSLDEILLALKDISQDETPLLVDVEDGEDGERVQVFIG